MCAQWIRRQGLEKHILRRCYIVRLYARVTAVFLRRAKRGRCIELQLGGPDSEDARDLVLLHAYTAAEVEVPEYLLFRKVVVWLLQPQLWEVLLYD